MQVYFFTLLAVMALGGLAQRYDYIRENEITSERVEHTLNAKVFYALASGVLVCVAGLRCYVGTDYGGYFKFYHKYADSLGTRISELDEPGYALVSWIATKIYDDGGTAIFLASLVTIGLMLFVIYRNTDKLITALMLFVFLGCWHGSFNGVRQYLAAAVLFCGYGYLKDKNFVKYSIVVVLAFLCHKSAIIMVLLYFAVHRKVDFKNLLLMGMVVIPLLSSYETVFRVAGWIMDEEINTAGAYTTHAVNILRVLAACAPALLFLVTYWKKEKTEEETFHLNLVTIHAAIRILTMNSALLYRIGIYTTPFQAISIAELMKGYSPRNRKLLMFVILVLYAAYWWYELQTSEALNTWHWIWQLARD